MSLINSILASFGSAAGGIDFVKLEADAKAFVTNAEKLLQDATSSNGNVIATVVALAEDFATIKLAISELVAIVADLKATHAAAPVASPAPAATRLQAAGVHSVMEVAATPAPVVFVAANPSADPFAPKPLVSAQVNEPHGGA